MFDEASEVDERHRIQEVLDRYPQLSSHFMVADQLYGPQCLRSDWSPKSVMGPHEIWMPSSANRLYDLARQAGCRVVLTGEIGDALNEGCDRVYFDLLRRRHFREAMRWFQIDWNRSKKKALWGLLFHGLVPLMAPFPLLLSGLLARERRKGVIWDLPGYFPSRLQKRIREVDKAIRLRRVRQFRVRCPSVRWTLHIVFPPMIGVTVPFPQPVEIRHPYFDRRLIEMALSMPKELKWDHKERGTFRAGRLHHREAMAGILPDKVRVGNLGVDFSPAIRHGLSPAAVRDWLMDSHVVHIFERGYVLPDLFLEEIAKWKEPEGYLMTMLCVEGWLRALASGGKIRRLIPPRRAPPMNAVVDPRNDSEENWSMHQNSRHVIHYGFS